MQTFLPYADFEKSAAVLDMKRLGKQRVETLQILNALANPQYGWQNHPATNMWRGYESTLIKYGIAICDEWISRGYKDTCLNKILDIGNHFDQTVNPWWLGSALMHSSHRGMLYRKDPIFYKDFEFFHHEDLEYWWPTKVT